MSTTVGPTPSNVICPNCRQQVTTRTEPKATTKTHLIALLLCCFWWEDQGDSDLYNSHYLPPLPSPSHLQLLALRPGPVLHGLCSQHGALLSLLQGLCGRLWALSKDSGTQALSRKRERERESIRSIRSTQQQMIHRCALIFLHCLVVVWSFRYIDLIYLITPNRYTLCNLLQCPTIKPNRNK